MKPVSILNSCCPQVGKSLLLRWGQIRGPGEELRDGVTIRMSSSSSKDKPILALGISGKPLFNTPFQPLTVFLNWCRENEKLERQLCTMACWGTLQWQCWKYWGLQPGGCPRPWIQPQPLTGGFTFKRQHMTPSKIAGSTCAAVTVHPPHPRGSQRLDSS